MDPLCPNERRCLHSFALHGQVGWHFPTAIKDGILITISFEDGPLHDTCVELQKAELEYGSLNAAALVTFISEALAFENVEELMGLLGDEINISADDSLSLAIGSDYRAALVVAGTRFKRDAEGRVIWSSVTRLKLVKMSRVP